MNVRKRDTKIDFVDLGLQNIRWIAVAIPTGGRLIDMPNQRLGNQHVQLLPTELVDEGMPQAVES
ncbi:hypothetical protein D3C75_1297930 [compost metagenome]